MSDRPLSEIFADSTKEILDELGISVKRPEELSCLFGGKVKGSEIVYEYEDNEITMEVITRTNPRFLRIFDKGTHKRFTIDLGERKVIREDERTRG